MKNLCGGLLITRHPPPSDIMPGNYQFNLRLTSMSFAKDTGVPVNFKCFFGGSGEPKYVTHDAILFRTSSMSNYIDYKLVDSSISNGVYTWDYDGEAQNSWGNQAYRTITLTTPIKYADNPEFYNWFVDNTISISKVLPAGTYLLKDNNDIDTKGYAGKDLEGVILFKSNNSIYSLMMVLYIPNLLTYNKTSVASSATWHDQNYRTIETFYDQPVTEDFYNWFMANIIVNPSPSIIKKGTYVFKDVSLESGKMWTKGSSVTQRVVAKSNNTDVSSITLVVGAEKTNNDGIMSGFNIETISYDLNTGGMTKTTYVYFNYAWTSNVYKTIEITEDCIVDEKFKKWFDYYTTKQ